MFNRAIRHIKHIRSTLMEIEEIIQDMDQPFLQSLNDHLSDENTNLRSEIKELEARVKEQQLTIARMGLEYGRRENENTNG